MTGTFAAEVKTALAGLSGTAGPADILLDADSAHLEIRQNANIPYESQVGAIRYAPMVPVPPTKITATNTAPLFPTSSVVIATTFLALPTVQTTVSLAQTGGIVASHANTVSEINSEEVRV